MSALLISRQRVAEQEPIDAAADDDGMVAETIANGNLARDVQVASADDTLGIAFRDMLAGLRRLVGKVKDAAADVLKLLRSAIANGEHNNALPADELFVANAY